MYLSLKLMESFVANVSSMLKEYFIDWIELLFLLFY